MNPWLISRLAACTHPAPPAPVPEPPRFAPMSARDLSERLASGALDPASLRDEALARIEAMDRQGPELRAVIAVDPEAAPAPGGPLHGLPLLVKDNTDAAGFPTTAGSLALAEHRPAADAFVVARLREAGAVILGKANLSEWSNFRSPRSSSGWSAVGGQTRNPHVLDRSPCGSSSGSAAAVAAGYVPFALGTETDGSILCPASVNGVVGVKPTLGLVSRSGIVPIAPSQDTAGPIAADVTSAAMLLEAMVAADPSDPASALRPTDGTLDTAYLAALRPDALQGARIGVARGLAEVSPAVGALFDAAVQDLRRLGAEVVEVPLAEDPAWGAAELEVLLHDLRPALEAYLAHAPSQGPRTLEALIAFDREHAAEEMRWFGQEWFEQALAHDCEEGAYDAAVATLRAVGTDRIDATLAADALDAIVAPTTGPAWPIDPVNGDHFTGGSSTITAVSGRPAVTVPMGRVAGLPVGLTLLGAAFGEARLLGLAYAYEQGTRHAPGSGAALAPTVR